MLLLTAAVVTLVSWILTGSLQTATAVQKVVPRDAARPHGRPWIELEKKNEAQGHGR